MLALERERTPRQVDRNLWIKSEYDMCLAAVSDVPLLAPDHAVKV